MDDIIAKRTNANYAHDKQGRSKGDCMLEERPRC